MTDSVGIFQSVLLRNLLVTMERDEASYGELVGYCLLIILCSIVRSLFLTGTHSVSSLTGELSSSYFINFLLIIIFYFSVCLAPIKSSPKFIATIPVGNPLMERVIFVSWPRSYSDGAQEQL